MAITCWLRHRWRWCWCGLSSISRNGIWKYGQLNHFLQQNAEKIMTHAIYIYIYLAVEHITTLFFCTYMSTRSNIHMHASQYSVWHYWKIDSIN